MLWHAHLTSLFGTSRSDVFVSSDDRQSAISDAMEAIAEWQNKNAETLANPLVSRPDDPFYETELSTWLGNVREELKEKIKEVESGALVLVKS
jgi:hypothetical protein